MPVTNRCSIARAPIFGDNLFTTESGIIAGWWERAKGVKPLEVFPFNPRFFGFEGIRVTMGKGSGKASITYRLQELGVKVPSDAKIDEILTKVKTKSEESKVLLSDAEFLALVKDVLKY